MKHTMLESMDYLQSIVWLNNLLGKKFPKSEYCHFELPDGITHRNDSWNIAEKFCRKKEVGK